MITDVQKNKFKNNFVSKKSHEKMLRDLLIQKKTLGPQKITKITDFLFLSGMIFAGSWSVVSKAHIQAFTFFMVLELSRSRSVARLAHVSKHSFSSQR